MSSCRSPKGDDAELIAQREVSFKATFTRELLMGILPKMLIQGDIAGLVDVVFEIDKRKLVAECLRDVANMVETKFTIDDITGGDCDPDE